MKLTHSLSEWWERTCFVWLPLAYYSYWGDLNAVILFVGMWCLLPPLSLHIIAKSRGRETDGVKNLSAWLHELLRYALFLEE